MKRYAFTLAEVLITLGIIGVVAALTIPTLMQKTDERETVAKVKKNVKIFSDAAEMAVLEHGNIDKWELVYDEEESIARVAEYLKPHLKIQKDCGQNICDEYSVESFYTLQGNLYSASSLPYTKLQRLILADGSVALIRAGAADFSVFIDTNGNNGPNTLGRDIFRFIYNKNGKIFFNNYGLSPAYSQEEGEAPNPERWKLCNPQYGEGWACLEWVYFKENMDYLHCADELYWNGPTRCS